MAKNETLPISNARGETAQTTLDKTLDASIDELIAITKQLRLLSRFITAITLFNLFWLLYIILPQIVTSGELLRLGVHAALLLVCLLLLWQYDNSRKIGDALFEEISDELQWHLVTATHAKSTDNVGTTQRPFLYERVTLRQYAQTTNLPILGRQGPIYYALFNIVVWLYTVISTGFLFDIFV